jgi:hypothetical protein
MLKKVTQSLCLSLFLLAACSSPKPEQQYLTLTLEDYQDRCTAIWNAQIVSVLMGWQFEHKHASVLWIDSINYPYSLNKVKEAGNCAPVDDDWYYEMANLRALEKYGPDLTVEQLGEQWAENNVGVWGSSGQARLNILAGIKAPDSGHPRFNRLWFTMGNQNRCDLYGMLHPGRPNEAGAMARNLGHINSYAEGTDGGVFAATMIALAFQEKDHQQVVRKAIQILDPKTPHHQCISMVVIMADEGYGPHEISEAVMNRWQIEYPATNNAVANMGIATIALWFGEGDFLKSLNLGFQLQDYTDADCNSTAATVVLAAMHGNKIIPPHLLDVINDRMRGDMIGHVELKPAVDVRISELGKKAAAVGIQILLKNGVILDDGQLKIPVDLEVKPQPAELFHPNEFVKYWDPEWSLMRAGHGAPGGGHRGIRGGTFIEDGILSTFPRDEVRGVRMERKLKVEGSNPKLELEVGSDPGRVWKLEVFVDNDRLVNQLVSGGPSLDWPDIPDTYFPSPVDEYPRSKENRKYQTVTVNLKPFLGKEVTLRLYQHTMVWNGYPGNAYWKSAKVML